VTKLHCFLLGILVAVLVGGVVLSTTGRAPTLTQNQLTVLVREHGFTPAEVVDEIDTVETTEGPVEVSERVEVEVESQPVSVNLQPETHQPAPPPPSPTVATAEALPCPDLLQDLYIGGKTTIDIVGTGKKKAVRTSWYCRVDGKGWSAELGPVPGDGVEFETLRQSTESRLRRDLWLGAIKSTDGVGPFVGASWKGHKWGVGAGVAAVQVRNDTEPLLFFSITKRW
jgi:hypothetical protein